MKIKKINGVKMQWTYEGYIPLLTPQEITLRIEENNKANTRYLNYERDQSFLRNMRFSH